MSDELDEIRKDLVETPAVITLDITVEKVNELTWEQWEAIESGQLNFREARSVIAVFVNGMTPEEARTMLGKLKTAQMVEISKAFTSGVLALKSVNPSSGDS